MLNKLLKFIEENPNIDCFSSRDINNPILSSRFIQVYKQGANEVPQHSVEDYLTSSKDYSSAKLLLSGYSIDAQLLAPSVPNSLLSLIFLL